MKCPSCGSSEIGARISQDGTKERFCRACGVSVVIDEPKAPVARQEPAQVAAAEPAPVVTARRRASKPGDDTAPANPIPAMRKRLRWLDSEIRRLRKLERERESLARVLSAASGKPVAVVRELRSSHG